MHIIVLTIFSGMMLIALMLAYQVFEASKLTRHQRLKRKYKQLSKYKTHAKAVKTSFTSPGYSGLWHQLLIRVQFDIATAERLLYQCQQRYPHKNERWQIEKVIWDLERDRR